MQPLDPAPEPDPRVCGPGAAPFARDDSLTPQQLAARLVACFGELGDRPDRMSWTFAASVATLDVAPGDPLRVGAMAIAADIDRGIGAGIPEGYHNPRHFLEVLLCALELSRRARLPDGATLNVLVAALMHDFHHDGSAGGKRPFWHEQLAVSKALPYLEAAGAASDALQRIACLVLATEPALGAPFARACHAFHRGEAASAPDRPPLPELDPLRTDPGLALEAVVLIEADVLPSIGLTVEYGHRVQSLLAAELGRTLDARDKLRFIDAFGELTIGAFFAPNRQALRNDCLRRLRRNRVQAEDGSGLSSVATAR
jgi:hypothetical protein